MPYFQSWNGSEQQAKSDDVISTTLLDEGLINSDYCVVRRLKLPAGATQDIETQADALDWFMVLSGQGRFGDEAVGDNSVCMAYQGTKFEIETKSDMEILWTSVQRASRFDPDNGEQKPGLKIVDWSHEPILQSEHDTRKRVYVTTPGLMGTGAIKAEIITYPAGAMAPEHHHEGAEHFQFVLSGEGTAVLNGEHQAMKAGDILYNFEHELHWFFTSAKAAQDFVFVELFIPGHCKTVWANDANACAWLPTGKDSTGSTPVREIGYHVHGQDDGL